jgi:hypothetical protein
LFKAELPQEEFRNVASHSMKATWLTAVGKAGVALGHRQLLGYHVAKGERSALNYNRDNLSEPMQEMVKVVANVASGRFCPDAPRGERWPDGVISPIAGIAIQAEEVLRQDTDWLVATFSRNASTRSDGNLNVYDIVEGSGDGATVLVAAEQFGDVNKHDAGASDVESLEAGVLTPAGDANDDVVSHGDVPWSSGAQSSDSDAPPKPPGPGGSDKDGLMLQAPGPADSDGVGLDVILAITAAQERCARPGLPAPLQDVFIHNVRKTAHLGHGDDASRLACGRIITEVFALIHTDPEGVWPKCRDCFHAGC